MCSKNVTENVADPLLLLHIDEDKACTITTTVYVSSVVPFHEMTNIRSTTEKNRKMFLFFLEPFKVTQIFAMRFCLITRTKQKFKPIKSLTNGQPSI